MGLGRKHNVRKAAVLKVLDEALARHHELFGLREVVALGDILLKRTSVDTDANCAARSTRGIDDSIDLGPIADITGIDAELGGTGLYSANGQLVLKWISATIGTGDSAQMVRKPSSAAQWARSHARYRSQPAPTRTLAQVLPWHQRYRCRSWIGPPPAHRHRSAHRPHARGASNREAKDGIKTIQTLPYRINRRMSERSI